MSSERRTTPLAHSCAAPHACPLPLRLDVLAHAPYFAGLSRDQIAAIERRMRVHGYDAGEIIYRTGTPADALFILATGRVKVLRPSLDGAEVLVDVIRPGALFGSVAALGHSTYPDTAQALTVSCALRISAPDFRAVLEEHPGVALVVLDDLAARLEQAQQTVRRLSGGTVEQRVASTLLALADQVGEPHGDSVLLQLPLTRGDLAAMTGTTTESVSRTLSKLRRQGVVETGRRWTAVTDREALAAIAHG
ncbi:Crp/Fnr family transcriptional regulator [Nocardioides pakistanensis]